MNNWRKYFFLVLVIWILLEAVVVLNQDHLGLLVTIILGVGLYGLYVLALNFIFWKEEQQEKLRERGKS